MTSNVVQMLTHAVRARRRVALRYHDHGGTRVIEPHAVYQDEHGQLMLDARQVRGYSASGRPPPFWRPFRIRKIVAVELLPETFVPRTGDGFDPASRRYRHAALAVAEVPRPAVAPPEVALGEVGPPRPPHLRRPG